MENKSIFKCPVCGKVLKKNEKLYKCESNHTFDIAKEGYTNLLPANKKNSKVPGDSKEMVDARRDFLKLGHYRPLSDKLNETITKYCENSDGIIFDAGCGEGYYAGRLAEKLEPGKKILAVDISKDAVRYAAKKSREIECAVASVFEIPVMERSIDVVFSVFAPFKEEEFHRVIKENGILIIVSPGAGHLLGLKRALYENVYLNDEEKLSLELFDEVEKVRVSYTFTLNESIDIGNLIKMTPYYWNTDMGKINEVIEKGVLETEAEFMISVFRKK